MVLNIYMFFADRNFVYLTGLKTSRQAVLLAAKEADGSVHEQVYIPVSYTHLTLPTT